MYCVNCAKNLPDFTKSIPACNRTVKELCYKKVHWVKLIGKMVVLCVSTLLLVTTALGFAQPTGQNIKGDLQLAGNSNTAVNQLSVANWVHLGKDDTFDYYIDSNNIEKNGDYIVYWGLWDAREVNQPTGVKKWLCKREVAGEKNWRQHPQEMHQYGVSVRQLEIYQYDANNQEIFKSTTPEGWRVVRSEEMWGQEISVLLKYVKGR